MAEPAESASHSRIVPLWLPITLSLLVLGIVAFFTVEPATLVDLRRTRWGLLALAPAVLGLRVALGAWRLLYFSRGQLRFAGAIRAQLAWDFFSIITPSTVGGGPIAPAYIARDSRIAVGDATALILFAILLDQIWFSFSIVIVIISSLHVDLIPDSLGTVGTITFVLYGAGYMVWTILFAYATFFRPQLLTVVIARIFSVPGLRRARGRALRVMVNLQNRARVLRRQQPLFYVKGLLLTIVGWLSRYGLIVIILASMHADLDYLLATLRTVAMMLGALVLPTPGGAGGVEALFALMLGPLMPQSLVAPALLIWRLLAYYLFLAAGTYITAHQVMRNTSGPNIPATADRKESASGAA